MKVIEITPTFIYSCQYCFKEFESSTEYLIQPKISPTCSYKCKFNVLYKFLKNNFSEKELKIMADYYKISPLKNQIIFELTKRMINLVSPLCPRCPNNLSGQSGHIINNFDKSNKESNFV